MVRLVIVLSDCEAPVGEPSVLVLRRCPLRPRLSKSELNIQQTVERKTTHIGFVPTVEVLSLDTSEHALIGVAEGQLLNVENGIGVAVHVNFGPAILLASSIQVDNLADRSPFASLEVPKTGADRGAVGLTIRRRVSALAIAIIAAEVVAVAIRRDVEVQFAGALRPKHETAGEAAIVVSAARARCRGVFVYTSVYNPRRLAQPSHH